MFYYLFLQSIFHVRYMVPIFLNLVSKRIVEVFLTCLRGLLSIYIKYIEVSLNFWNKYELFFISNTFSVQPQYCLIFWYVEPTINLDIILRRHVMFWCLFIFPSRSIHILFIFIFISINHIFSFKQGHLLFGSFCQSFPSGCYSSFA